MLQFQQSRQKELVLHDAVLDAALLGEPRNRERVCEARRARLFTIDVFSRLDRLANDRGAHLRRAGVEENLVVRIGERGREIGRPALDAMSSRERLDFFGAPPDQDWVRHH